MKKSVLLALILIAFDGHAQFTNFTLRASAAYCLINSMETNSTINTVPISPSSGFTSVIVSVGSIKQSFKSKLGFDISGRFKYGVSNRFFLSSGLSATLIRFQRTFKIESLNEMSQPAIPLFPSTQGVTVGSMFGNISPRGGNGNIIKQIELSSQSPELGNTNTWNLQFPILAGTSFFKEKFVVKVGLAFSYLLYASEVKQRYDLQTATISDHKDTSKKGFNEFLTSGVGETTFQATKKLGVDVTAQHFFTPIYSTDNESNDKARCNNFTVGISYNF